HACGHDGHTSILIGAARVLSKLSAGAPLPRPVKLVFQPAEEQEGGAERMVAEGVLTDKFGGVATRRMFGLHGWPGMPIGVIGTRPGPLLASADMFELSITGRGGHGAMPHTTADPIVAASHVVTALQCIVSRNLNPTDPGVVTIGTIHAGTIENVIPPTAVLTGTIRAVTDATRTMLHKRVEEVASRVAAAHGCEAAFDLRLGYPVTMNHPGVTDYVLDTARGMVGEESVIVADQPSMGAEDFSYYSQKIPSCFYLIGLRPINRDTYPNLHTPEFDFNDDAIRVGVGMMCRLALGAAS
ncbi:MAG: M20 metallopeptidase family protein, partial [Planctomycetota bacterium]